MARRRWSRPPPSATTRADAQVPRRPTTSRPRRSRRGLRMRTHRAAQIVPMLCGAAFKNKGVQAMLDAVIDYLPSPVDIPPVKGELPTHGETARARGRADDEPFSGARVQDHDRPVRRSAHVLPCVLRASLKSGRHVYNRCEGTQGAHRAPAADARQPARGDRGSARRRHRRGGRPEGHAHRRDAVRRRTSRSSSRRWSSPSP